MAILIKSKIHCYFVCCEKPIKVKVFPNFFCKIYRITDDPVYWADRNFAQVRAVLSRKPIRQCAASESMRAFSSLLR